jgi:hypothetical protein
LADVTGSLNGCGINSLEENAEENKKMGFLKWVSLKKTAAQKSHFQIARFRAFPEYRWDGGVGEAEKASDGIKS